MSRGLLRAEQNRATGSGFCVAAEKHYKKREAPVQAKPDEMEMATTYFTLGTSAQNHIDFVSLYCDSAQ